MKTFSLTQGQQTCAGLNGHPDELRLTLTREQCKRLIQQIVERMDDEPEAALRLFGTWK